MTRSDRPTTTIQDPAALRQIRDLERVIEARLNAARDSSDRVEAAHVEAAAMLDAAAADADEAAARQSEAILDAARGEALTHEAEQQQHHVDLTARAQQLRVDLVEAVLAAVLPDPGRRTEAQP